MLFFYLNFCDFKGERIGDVWVSKLNLKTAEIAPYIANQIGMQINIAEDRKLPARGVFKFKHPTDENIILHIPFVQQENLVVFKYKDDEYELTDYNVDTVSKDVDTDSQDVDTVSIPGFDDLCMHFLNS